MCTVNYQDELASGLGMRKAVHRLSKDEMMSGQCSAPAQ